MFGTNVDKTVPILFGAPKVTLIIPGTAEPTVMYAGEPLQGPLFRTHCCNFNTVSGMLPCRWCSSSLVVIKNTGLRWCCPGRIFCAQRHVVVVFVVVSALLVVPVVVAM